MKAISLWQPWATFMALGLKRFETRSWPTAYRGPLAICAAKIRIKEFAPDLMGRLLETEYYQPEDQTVADTLDRLPYGAVLCVVEVVGCVPTELYTKAHYPLSRLESDLGDYSARRWVWQTTNLRRLLSTVPVIGRQGLFDLPPEIEARVLNDLSNHEPTALTLPIN